nr:MAG TPA: hypothetical protein [Caudoviricetes sp.]
METKNKQACGYGVLSISKSASEQSGAIFIPKFRKEQDHD